VREGLVLQTDVGWGEIAPLPGVSRETFDDALAEVKLLWPDMSRATLPSVRFGYASAQKPLSSFRKPFGAFLTPHSGCTTLKLKLGHLSIPEAISLVKQYKDTYRLRLDGNRMWSLEQALAFARAFKPTDFEYLEEPLATYEEMAHFVNETGFPLAVEDPAWIDLPSLKAVVVKPTVWGHLPKLPPHLQLILSPSYESGLGLIHIALLSQNSLPVGLDTYRMLKDDILTHPIRAADGHFSWDPTNPPINMEKLCPIAL
jgi:O-succinylbenzoate synthase